MLFFKIKSHKCFQLSHIFNFPGFLGAGFQLSVTIGVELTFVIGKYLPWTWLAVQCCIYPFALLVAMCFMPETPTWLANKGRISEATEAQLFLHGDNGIFNELNLATPTDRPPINNSNSIDSQSITISPNDGWLELLKPHILKPLTIALALMFFQQFSGVNAIIFYTTVIFDSTGSHFVSSADATIIVGAVQVFGTLIACFLNDRS